MMRAALRTTTGTQDFTISGFGTPVAAIFVMGENQADGDEAGWRSSFGATDGTNHWCTAVYATHAAASSNTARRGATDEVFMILDSGSGAVDAEGNFDSFITDGVRVNVAVVGNPNARLLTVYLIGGSGVTAACGKSALGDAAATVTITPNLETDVLINASHGVIDDVNATAGYVRRGFASRNSSGTITQCGQDVFMQDAQTETKMLAHVSSNEAIAYAFGEGATFGNVTSTEFDMVSGSADLTVIEMGWVAINLGSGGESWAGIQDTPITTGEHTFTGVGFEAGFGMMFTNMMSAVNADKSDAEAEASGVGGFSATTEFSHGWVDNDGDTNTTNRSAAQAAAITLDKNNGANAHQDAFDATFVAFTSDGVTLDFTVADGTARKWPSLFIKR